MRINLEAERLILRNLVPEAIQNLIDYVGKTREIKAIEGEFAVENFKSQRVMEKLGMTYDRDAEYEKLDGSAKFKAKIFRREFKFKAKLADEKLQEFY